jgi:hypothetical protein
MIYNRISVLANFLYFVQNAYFSFPSAMIAQRYEKIKFIIYPALNLDHQ